MMLLKRLYDKLFRKVDALQTADTRLFVKNKLTKKNLKN